MDNQFRKTERMLYNYFKKEEVIRCKKYMIVDAEKRIKQLEEKIRNSDVNIDHDLQPIAIGERVQTSSSSTSYAERAMIKAINELIKEQVDKKQKILNLEKDISDLESDNKMIEFNIQMLNEEDKEFIKLKYKEEKSIEYISQKLGMSVATAYRKREKLIKDIIKWIEILN